MWADKLLSFAKLLLIIVYSPNICHRETYSIGRKQNVEILIDSLDIS